VSWRERRRVGTVAREGQGRSRDGRGGARRIIFEDWPWFDVSSALVQERFLREMRGSEVKRYVTLRYLANERRSNVVQASLKELEKLDGVSPRRAHEVNGFLEEMRMVEVERHANPYRYRLYLPSEWRKLARRRSKGLPHLVQRQVYSFQRPWALRSKLLQARGGFCRKMGRFLLQVISQLIERSPVVAPCFPF
jgi:hypothetical protein